MHCFLMEYNISILDTDPLQGIAVTTTGFGPKYSYYKWIQEPSKPACHIKGWPKASKTYN